MRGTTDPQTTLLSILTPDSLIPPVHPIRRIKKVVEAVLADLNPEFDAMYATTSRQSVPPEQLLKASVLMALYSIRSERQFCERLQYDLLFKSFLDLNIDAEAFDHSTFSRNRERLLKHEIADHFFAAVVRQAHLRRYLSGEHFSVDGTLLEDRTVCALAHPATCCLEADHPVPELGSPLVGRGETSAGPLNLIAGGSHPAAGAEAQTIA